SEPEVTPEPEIAPEPEATPGPEADPAPETAPGPEAAHGGADRAEHTRTPDASEDVVTDKGLPKRTPRLTSPAPAPGRRSGSVDADALRRRLGGFRRGAEAGYRDVEAEIAERTARDKVPSPQETHAHAAEDTGGTVEEASS
ncbi:histidine kinase, partial [Streptomyces sp. NPDC003401]